MSKENSTLRCRRCGRVCLVYERTCRYCGTELESSDAPIDWDCGAADEPHSSVNAAGGQNAADAHGAEYKTSSLENGELDACSRARGFRGDFWANALRDLPAPECETKPVEELAQRLAPMVKIEPELDLPDDLDWELEPEQEDTFTLELVEPRSRDTKRVAKRSVVPPEPSPRELDVREISEREALKQTLDARASGRDKIRRETLDANAASLQNKVRLVKQEDKRLNVRSGSTLRKNFNLFDAQESTTLEDNAHAESNSCGQTLTDVSCNDRSCEESVYIDADSADISSGSTTLEKTAAALVSASNETLDGKSNVPADANEPSNAPQNAASNAPFPIGPHEFDAPPELPDFSQERDPVVELPDLNVRARLIGDPTPVELPRELYDFDPDARPVVMNWRQFKKIADLPSTKMVFSWARKRFWFAAVLIELILCFPFGYSAWRSLRFALELIVRKDYDGAAYMLGECKRSLITGACFIAGILAAGLFYIAATQVDWGAIQWHEY